MYDTITINGARLHNLKNISISIPKNKLVVLTGLSGSGKSTLAFDTLHKEGQRQYMESMGTVTDYVSKPKVDSITGLSPSISVGQNLTNRSPRSTVGTTTEVFTYLRVLFARLGHRICPTCGVDVPPSLDVQESDGWDDEPDEGDPDDTPDTESSYPCPKCGTAIPELGMARFSFNKPAGACPACTGLGSVNTANLALLLDEDRSIREGGVIRWDKYEIARYAKTLENAGRRYGFEFDSEMPIAAYRPIQRDLLLYGVHSPQFRRHYPNIEPPETVAQGRFEGVVTNLLRRYAENIHKVKYREKLEKLLIQDVCPDCGGERLHRESRAVTVNGWAITELCKLPLSDLAEWIEELSHTALEAEWLVIEPIVADLRERVRRLVDVGVGYLTMERSTPTLSGGEAQRLRLASLLGSGLTGVMYVLDEPTIGLHPKDTQKLIRVMGQLRDLGNTVIVIEHDSDVMQAADHIIDIGPGAGREGGELVACGTPEEVAASAGSITGGYLSGRLTIATPRKRRKSSGKALTIHNACEHNLQNITVSLPLSVFTVVTGVSGSGKSSLLFDIVDCAARQRLYGASRRPGKHDRIEGWEYVDHMITIDQTAIGRTPRSNAATFTDAFTPIRQTFAATPVARDQKLKAGHFSFNVAGGRCERCQGAGLLTVQMHFLPDVQVRCPACHGRRFKRDVLAVRYRDHNIADILEMTIAEALSIFEAVPSVASRLELLNSVGLGYLQLGQPATTLSGGEAQRVKLAKELSRRAAGRTIYLLDEPTTGLHPADIARLLNVLQRLVDAGNSVVVIEHNLDVIKCADWVIDLGPEGGVDGGRLMAEGTPEQVAGTEASHTGRFLRTVL